jgi:FKBP-type peptidyl-prolyl cis-trans isomerase 2
MPDHENVITIEIAQLPGSEDLNVSERVFLRNMMGQPFPVTVTAKDEKMITLDANHEMAGKELNFRIELVEVQ